MSSRARRIVDRSKAEPFAWVALGDMEPSASAAPPAASPRPHAVAVEPHAIAEVDAPPLAPPPATDHEQARQQLAELEREAFAKGYASGEHAGLEAGTTRADGMIRRLGDTLTELDALRQQIITQTERQMVQIALAVARRILRHEVSIDQDLVVAIARVALDRLGDQATATIRLNPDDCAAVAARRGAAWAGSRVTVVPDSNVGRGGCRVESDLGFVDAGVDAQFEQLVHALLGDGDPVAVAVGDDGHLLADPVP